VATAALALLLVVSALGTKAGNAATGQGGSRGFVVLDALGYRDKPDLARHGIGRAAIIGRQMWGNAPTARALEGPPPRESASRLAAWAASRAPVVILDVEHWPVSGTDPLTVQRNQQKLVQTLRLAREGSGTAKLGYYGLPPVRDYWRALKGSGSREFREWQAENDRLRRLAYEVDVLFPSAYTFYDDREGWAKYAVAQIEEARRYAIRKPVYLFLWPQFHDSSRTLRGQYLPRDFWRLELETAYQHADGVVIWGGSGQVWDEGAPWWEETKAFLEAVGTVKRGFTRASAGSGAR
jgi:hypothetical protein